MTARALKFGFMLAVLPFGCATLPKQEGEKVADFDAKLTAVGDFCRETGAVAFVSVNASGPVGGGMYTGVQIQHGVAFNSFIVVNPAAAISQIMARLNESSPPSSTPAAGDPMPPAEGEEDPGG